VSGRLYRCWSGDGTLLYIGLTRRAGDARITEHTRTSAWWAEVATVTWEEVTGSLDAAEQAAVRDERPVYNRAYQQRIECWMCQDKGWVFGAGWARKRCPRCGLWTHWRGLP
jgi:hypothetical protein